MKPRILVVYYSFTHQTRNVAHAMMDVFREQGCETTECPIEFVDERYRISMPFRPFWPTLFRWLIPQTLRKTGAIKVPEDVLQGEYDLICIGSPTWWLHPAMPITSFLRSDMARKLLNGKRFAAFAVCRQIWWNNLRLVKKMGRQNGGTFVDGAAFCFRGNQVQTALSFISYMQFETNRDRYCGVRIYEFGVTPEGIDKAKQFARSLIEAS
jgi:flavodoxin